MPRDQINFPAEPVRTADAIPVLRDGMTEIAGVPEPSGAPIYGPAVHVSWMRGDFVQVAMVTNPEYLQVAIDHPNEDIGRTSIYSPPMTRDEINRMIRSLRRARDQVFGRDE